MANERKEVEKIVKREFPKEISVKIIASFEKHYKKLCLMAENQSRELKRHTVGKIYPLVSWAEALIGNGMSRDEAKKWLLEAYSEFTEKGASLMRNAIKIVPGGYRLVPGMFISQLEKNFGRDAGFDYRIYETERTRGKFDMLSCPYHEIMKELGYGDFTFIFCHQDDINDGAMSPRLKWARTKTIGRGDDICDFDIYVVPRKK